MHAPVLGKDGKPIMVVQNPVDVTELYRFDEQSPSGTVTAASPGPGRGSTFAISLPAFAAGPGGLPEAAGGGATASALPRHVMIVDDNVDAAESLAVLLEAQGHRVAVQSHPHDAIAAAKEDPPQVFILDIGLPEMDGYELARRLRADPATGHALFVALTGYGQAHGRILARSVGFDHHFVKPVELEKLRAIFAAVGD